MTAAAIPTTPITRPRLSALQQAMLSFYWFANGAHWIAILLVLAPLQVLQIVGDRTKGETLGYVVGFGAFISMIIAPLFGAWSDRIHTRFGRRTPFLVVGTLLNVVGLLGLAYLPRVGDPSARSCGSTCLTTWQPRRSPRSSPTSCPSSSAARPRAGSA